jgi:hypothetical protein
MICSTSSDRFSQQSKAREKLALVAATKMTTGVAVWRLRFQAKQDIRERRLLVTRQVAWMDQVPMREPCVDPSSSTSLLVTTGNCIGKKHGWHAELDPLANKTLPKLIMHELLES